MKRLLAISVAVIALATLVTSCGVAEDDVAATVSGDDITVADVAALARTKFIAEEAESSGIGLVSNPEGTTGGAKQRLALSYILQGKVYEAELAARDDEVTSEDRQAAESSIASYEESRGALGELERGILLEFVAAQVGLIRSLDLPEPELPDLPEAADPATVATPEAIAAYFDANQDEFGTIACVDGFAVAEGNQAAAQAAIDRGDAVAAIIADTALAAQPISPDGAETCVPTGQIAGDIATAVIEGELGVWRVSVVEQSTGEPFAVFIRPNSRSAATVDNPAVVDTITQILQQEAQQAQQEREEAIAQAQQAQQSAAGGELSKIVARADVEIDPRYGTFDASDPSLILPPPTPASKQPVTTLPAGTTGA